MLSALALGAAVFLRHGCSVALGPDPGTAYCDPREAFVYDHTLIVIVGIVAIWLIGLAAIHQLARGRG